MKYNKLVRDKIPQIIKQNGQTAIIHIANSKEYWLKLKEKLAEEVKEFSADTSIEEFADVLEVLDAIAVFKNFSKSKVLSVKRKKAKQRGKFKNRIILDETEK